jgi:hypothetical protein
MLRRSVASLIGISFAAACARPSGIPPLPQSVPFTADSATQRLAAELAPVLYVQRDEFFPLRRVVAVVHPTRPIIAYAMDWQWDVNGQWLPWTKSSDEEELWVGYDPATHAPIEMWTYWHGTLLHTDWRGKGRAAAFIQWGKHGSLPAGIIESDLPRMKTLNVMYALEFVLLPDIWLGRLSHGGPWGFFHGYTRYRDFATAVPLADRLDAVVRTARPAGSLRAVFGSRYSNKRAWPDSIPKTP